MNNLKEINEEFFKPYRTVMEYIGLTGLNIFDEKGRGLSKMRYFYVFYFIFHVISMSCHWVFIIREFSKGTKLIEIPVEFSYCNNNLEALLIFIQLLRRKDHIKAFVFEMEKEWRKDESLSPELVVMKKKLLKETYLYNYTMIVAYEMQCSQYIITISMNYLRILFLIIQVEYKEIIALKNNEDKDKLFKETISRHSRLLDLLANVSTTFGCLFAINYIFLSSTICFCILSACVNGSLEDLKILSISLLVIINVFYCCKSGENLVNAASEVSTAIYDTPWYECSYQHKRDILFILMRSQRVAYVTSTSFIKISLKTFIRVITAIKDGKVSSFNDRKSNETANLFSKQILATVYL
ncbi:unnamed protein product [Colias eurytheme]|nr:unnamed protein product [Colias eurytheme]